MYNILNVNYFPEDLFLIVCYFWHAGILLLVKIDLQDSLLARTN